MCKKYELKKEDMKLVAHVIKNEKIQNGFINLETAIEPYKWLFTEEFSIEQVMNSIEKVNEELKKRGARRKIAGCMATRSMILVTEE